MEIFRSVTIPSDLGAHPIRFDSSSPGGVLNFASITTVLDTNMRHSSKLGLAFPSNWQGLLLSGVVSASLLVVTLAVPGVAGAEEPGTNPPPPRFLGRC